MVFKERMLLTYSRASSFGAIVATALFCAAGAAVAASPVVLGYSASNGTDGGACTAYGYSVSGHEYNLPYNGVLTRYQVTTGDDTSTTSESARLRTVHSNGSLASAYVASEGAPNSLLSPMVPTSSVSSFDARVPATAGDHLAVGVTTDGAYTGRTNCTALEPSQVGHSGKYNVDPVLGASHPDWVDVTGRIPNVRAMLEPDADSDGYGDGSQDLCPTDAALYFFPCTGALFGTNTAVTHSASNLACAPSFNCLRVQTTIGTISTAAPFRGVIVRWRASSNLITNMRVRVVKPTDATHFQVVRSSEFAPVAAAPAPANTGMPAQMTIVPTRVPIDQGDLVGLDIPSGPAVNYGLELPGSTYLDLANPADGGTVGKPSGFDKQIFYNADIERDADGDGYGDETQDLCPTDATRQTVCASTADTTKPTITKFSVSPRTFRASTEGAVITKSIPKGTKFKLELSERASVSFSVYKIVNKKPRLIHSFTRSGRSGANRLAYSGRYRPLFKTRKLPAGRYKLRAIATDSAGNKSSSKSATFTLAQ